MGTITPTYNLQQVQFGQKKQSSQVDVGAIAGQDALKGASMGASLGSAVGPWGTVIGGAVGGAAGGIYGFVTGSEKKKKENEEMANNYSLYMRNLSDSGNVIQNQQAAMGDPSYFQNYYSNPSRAGKEGGVSQDAAAGGGGGFAGPAGASGAGDAAGRHQRRAEIEGALEEGA